MAAPRAQYHKKIDRWREFEEDEKEYRANRDKYKNISSKPECYSWFYRHKNRQLKTERRLADIYEFKINFESNLIN